MSKRTTRQPKTFRIELGNGDYATYSREDGYSLYVSGSFRGSFEWLDQAREARNAAIFEEVRREMQAAA